ncbi:hypothetical protein EVJ58_g10990 [Rhodofomes roseus]|uniref:Uncharacterized protein n=1 Tax=Rhodofomes roseus TaxID=34475 RepID=A0A4Y9XLJ0_9APHY|nr:hypothetical protein EVJ58_g10990 [Rhodofomes roseus]
MSAIRILRHVSLSASRTFAVRGAACSVSRAALPFFAAHAARPSFIKNVLRVGM